MGPDRNTHIRNFAIVLVLAVAVWQLPGGGTGAATIGNIFSVLFLGGMIWMLMLGAAGWAIYSVWRSYKTY